MLPIKKILCPTDFSEPSTLALEKASELAHHFGAQLYVLHVVATLNIEFDPDDTVAYDKRDKFSGARHQLYDLIAAHVLPEVRVETLIKLGNAEAEIDRTARHEGADLIVIATHGQTGWRHLVFGSVTERVLQRSSCPLLVIHSPRD